MKSADELIEARQARLKERGENDLRAVLRLPEGRRLMWSILTAGRIFQPSYTGDRGTDYNEGKRAVGLEVMAKIMSVQPAAFLQMSQEHSSEENAFAEEVEKAKQEEERNG